MMLKVVSSLLCILAFNALVDASNYDAYIHQIEKRNHQIHEAFTVDPAAREGLDQLNSRYHGDHPLFNNAGSPNEEVGEIPVGLWQDLLRDIEGVRARGGHRFGSRGVEAPAQNMLWGEHRVSGGAGERQQWFVPGIGPVSKTEVKTDKLPAYCDPPNPCPIGSDPDSMPSPCDINIPDTKAFNRNWIWSKMIARECPCDQEHMKHCPSPREVGGVDRMPNEDEAVEEELSPGNPFLNGAKRDHLAVKKSPSTSGDPDYLKNENPWLQGDVLHSVKKKTGPLMENTM